jgi:hypothetical protein
MHFADKLAQAVKRRGNGVLVGLDPRWEQLPESLRQETGGDFWLQRAIAYRKFCCAVIDVVAPLVPAVKPQAAFFEQLGPFGLANLACVIVHAHEHGLLVILDGKRNDIGSTATAYAEGYLGDHDQSAWGADALTVSPYLGDDSLTPFVEVCKQRDTGMFVVRRFRIWCVMGDRSIAAWRNMWKSWRAKPLANADTALWAPSWAPRIQSNLPNSAPRCRTLGFLFPALEVRADRRPTSRPRSMPTDWEQLSTTRAGLSLPMRARSTHTSAKAVGKRRLTRLRAK